MRKQSYHRAKKSLESFLVGFYWIAAAACLSLTGVTVRGAAAQDRVSPLGREVAWIDLDGSLIFDLAWSPDQKRIIAATIQRRAIGEIVSIDSAVLRVEWKIDHPSSFFAKTAFLDGGATILTQNPDPRRILHPDNWDKILSILDASTGRIVRYIDSRVHSLHGPHIAADFSVSSDGSAVAVTAADGLGILGYSTSTWTRLWRLDSSNIADRLHYVALDSRRRSVVATVRDRGGYSIQSWDTLEKVRRGAFVVCQNARSRPPQRLLIDERTGTLFIGDGIIHDLGPSERPTACSTERASHSLVEARNPSTGELIKAYTAPELPGNLTSFALSPNGRYVLASQGTGPLTSQIHAWNVDTGHLITSVTYSYNDNYGHNSDAGVKPVIGPIAFSPDGRKIAIARGFGVLIIELDARLFP